MQIFYENIPAELKSLPRWVCWRFEQRGGKATKVPYTPTGRRAKSNDPATWAAFDECRAAHERGRFDGIGFQLDGSGIVGVDIDHARDAAGNWSGGTDTEKGQGGADGIPGVPRAPAVRKRQPAVAPVSTY